MKKKDFLAFLVIMLFTTHGLVSYELGIVTMFRNEANYLKEWIEYHRLVGVDHFYLYNLGSTDRYLNVLRPYIKEKIVTLEEKIQEVVQWLEREGTSTFKNLSNARSRIEAITIFLAILHLAREQRIQLEQLEHFSDIIITTPDSATKV